MANNWKNRGLVTLTLAVVLAILVAACAAPGPTPAAEKAAKIGTASLFTGALASTGTPIISGQIDYVKWLNEHGGIDGVKVDILWQECGGTVPKEITALRRFRDGGRVGYCRSSPAQWRQTHPTVKSMRYLVSMLSTAPCGWRPVPPPGFSMAIQERMTWQNMREVGQG